MKLTLSIIVEALAQDGTSSSLHCLDTAQVIHDVLHEPSIDGAQLISCDNLPDTFDENALYILNELANRKIDVRSHPNHALVVYALGESLDEQPWHDKARLLAFGTTDAPLPAVFNTVVSCLSAYAAWDAELTDAILQKAGIADVLDIGSKMLANPIAFFDTGSALVAHSGQLVPGYEETIWGRVISEGASPMDYYTQEETREIAKQLESSPLPIVLAPQRAPQHMNLAAYVRGTTHIYGTIGQVDLVSPFTPGQVALANHVRLRLQQFFSLAGSPSEDEDELVSVLRRMLDGDAADRSILSFHLRKHDWRIEDAYRISVCPIPQGTMSKVPNTTRMRNIKELVPESLVFVHDEAVVILEHAGRRRRKDPLQSGTFKTTLSSLGMMAASSIWFDSLVNVTVFYRQALICLAESERAGLSGVLSYQDVFETHIAHLISSNVPAESICHPGVLSLVTDGYKEDVKQGRELIEQLYAYLASGRNLHRCARLLFVHHNTLAYRIERLEKLLDMDFMDLTPREIVHLELSCLLALHA